MASSILFKFRSGTTFEALPLPGSAARLIDVKKAIVEAKKLDQGSMDFDLSVQDASNHVTYTDDAQILPRGTRLIVQRLPAARGQGILAHMARSRCGQTGMSNGNHAASAATPSDFYTIDARSRYDDNDEFVSSAPPPPPPPLAEPQSEQAELAALRAITGGTGTTVRSGVPAAAMRPVAGSGPPPPRPPHGGGGAPRSQFVRPNADPELREQEPQPKKRATGIPRTFLSLSAPAAPTEDDANSNNNNNNLTLLQPNHIGFAALVQRGGGQSETNTARDLTYAMAVTNTTVPDYLQCSLCHGVVRDATMLPWDVEGRTTCEPCIRTALTTNGFVCPLTQQEGVSPDDLLPNHALRKAATQFVATVFEKMKEINEQASVEEEIQDAAVTAAALPEATKEKGVVLTRRISAAEQRKQKEDDPFGGGGDDDFGGDVFAVGSTSPDPAEAEAAEAPKVEDVPSESVAPAAFVKQEEADKAAAPPTPVVSAALAPVTIKTDPEATSQQHDGDNSRPPSTKSSHVAPSPSANSHGTNYRQASGTPTNHHTNANSNTVAAAATTTTASTKPPRRRGPPVGYTMGPAGGSAIDRGPRQASSDRSPRHDVRQPSIDRSVPSHTQQPGNGPSTLHSSSTHHHHHHHHRNTRDGGAPRYDSRYEDRGGHGSSSSTREGSGSGSGGYYGREESTYTSDRGTKRERSASYEEDRYGREHTGGGNRRGRGGGHSGRGGWNDHNSGGRGGSRGRGRGGYRGGRGRY